MPTTTHHEPFSALALEENPSLFASFSKLDQKVMDMTTLMNLNSLISFKTSFSSNSLFLFASIWE